jgi:Arc/MetJ-type ribon-helix-helix transcriptional regulator
MAGLYYASAVKTLTVRLPETLVVDIEEESRVRKVSKSDVIRERLRYPARSAGSRRLPPDTIADLVGSVDGLPVELSARKKAYLKAGGYGKKRTR